MRVTVLVLATAAMLAAPAAAQRAPVADFTFDYSYPAQARAIAPLRAWLDADKARKRATIVDESARDKREAKASGYPYRPHDSTTEWKVVTDTPRFLSLSGSHYTYTGGAHGGTNTLSLVWDKAAARRLAPMDLFASSAAVERAIRPTYCGRLNAQRKERRGEPIRRGSTALFDTCPPFQDLVLLLGSTDRRAIDRVGLVADQYIAGPYAEGQYEVTLPVTPALLGAVKPAYRRAFTAR